jgi:integrase
MTDTNAIAGPVRQAIVRAERRGLPRYLVPAQIRDLLEVCKTRRDQMLVRVGWETGGRISELLGLARQDIDLANRQIRLQTLKQPKDRRRKPRPHYRWIPINDALAADLANYVMKLDGDRLFPIGRGRAFEIIRDAARVAGVAVQGGGNVSPHTLRHSFAVHLLNCGVPINLLKELLGHSSILTTMIYLRVVPADFRAFLSRVPFE